LFCYEKRKQNEFVFLLASYPNAEIHLTCGARDKIGVPRTLKTVLPSPVSTAFDHGWSRLAFDNQKNSTISSRLSVTTPYSPLNTHSSK